MDGWPEAETRLGGYSGRSWMPGQDPLVLPGGQGQALKGLGVMGSELHFRMTNVEVPRSNRAVENEKPTENSESTMLVLGTAER